MSHASEQTTGPGLLERFPANEIHPTVIVEGDVRIGTGNRILPYSILIGPLEIGDDNIIGPHATIGTTGEVRGYPRADADAPVRVGSRCTVKEFATLQKPWQHEFTIVGDDCFLMHGSHVGRHDVHLEEFVTAAPNVVFGGMVRAMRGSTFGMNATTHQFTTIGAYAMIAASAPVAKDLRPFARYIPGKPLGANVVGAQRNGFSDVLDQVEGYVLEGTRPTDTRLLELVDAWHSLHEATGRPAY